MSPDEKKKLQNINVTKFVDKKKPRMFSDLELCCWGLFTLEHFAPKCLRLTKSDLTRNSKQLWSTIFTKLAMKRSKSGPFPPVFSALSHHTKNWSFPVARSRNSAIIAPWFTTIRCHYKVIHSIHFGYLYAFFEIAFIKLNHGWCWVIFITEPNFTTLRKNV